MEFQDLSADTLVRLVRDGKHEAFDALVKRYQLEVYRKANLLLFDRSATDDIVQDVFYKAFVNIGQYNLGTSFRNWLMGIAQNSVLHELRRSRRYDGRLSKYAELVENRLESTPPEIDEEQIHILEDCITRLEPLAAQVVRARYTRQESIDQIAESAGRTSGAVRTFLYRARAQLRDCMERKGAWR